MVSLAADQRERAIAVVLTGLDSDGTLSVKAIKAEGGLTDRAASARGYGGVRAPASIRDGWHIRRRADRATRDTWQRPLTCSSVGA